MTGLLELRERAKQLYNRYAVFIIPVVKFLLAFIMVCTINNQLGYMGKLDNLALVLIVSLTCSFLPYGAMIFFGFLLTMAHMYALSLEVTIVGLCFYLILFLMYFRFSPKDALVVVLMPILFVCKIPYVLPIALGLMATPVSAVSIACGVAVYFFLQTVSNNASTILTMGESEYSAKIKLVVEGLINNKVMIVYIVAFAITVVVVYLVRRMAIDYCWTIAMVAGAMVELVILLLGDLLYDTNISVFGAIIGALLAIAFAKLIEFFKFCVDYTRTEKVQFEDDDYYYYVKAVPKMAVAAPEKTVKKINTQTRSSEQSVKRSVVTERTRSQEADAKRRQEPSGLGRSMTIKNAEEPIADDDLEELF